MAKSKVIYLVYPKRALYQERSSLPLLDRETDKKRAIVSAIKWGAIVIKISTGCQAGKDPVETSEVVFVHRPRVRKRKSDTLTHSDLMRKLRALDADRLSRGPPKKRD